MKKIICEMCGNNELIKKDGMFVCQFCGTKYTAEEAKKLVVEGTVKIDSSDELDKLHKAAKNAREISDYSVAIKHYETISAKDPNNWEALFYLSVLKIYSIKNGEIGSTADSISKCLPKVLELISDIKDEEVRKQSVKEVAETCYNTSLVLFSATNAYYDNLTKGTGMIALTGISGMITSGNMTVNASNTARAYCLNIAQIMLDCGNNIESHFDMSDSDYTKYAVYCWEKVLLLNKMYKSKHNFDLYQNKSVTISVADRIKKYDSNNNTANTTTEEANKKESTGKKAGDGCMKVVAALLLIAAIGGFLLFRYGYLFDLFDLF